MVRNKIKIAEIKNSFDTIGESSKYCYEIEMEYIKSKVLKIADLFNKKFI